MSNNLNNTPQKRSFKTDFNQLETGLKGIREVDRYSGERQKRRSEGSLLFPLAYDSFLKNVPFNQRGSR